MSADLLYKKLFSCYSAEKMVPHKIDKWLYHAKESKKQCQNVSNMAQHWLLWSLLNVSSGQQKLIDPFVMGFWYPLLFIAKHRGDVMF